MGSDEQWRKKYEEFKQLQEHIEQISEHVERLHGALREVDLSIEAVEGLQKEEKGKEIFAPVANGIFLKTHLADTQTLLVNVGADTVVEKSMEEVIGLLTTQKDSMRAQMHDAQSVLENYQKKAMQIVTEVEAAEE